jgi:cysteine synthase B
MLAKYQTAYNPGLDSIEEQVGNTPMLRFEGEGKGPIQILAKAEWYQLGASVKSRPALNMIKNAVVSGELSKGKRILDASSGNTAIAYASIGAKLGIGVTICLPENASNARKVLLNTLGAKLVFSSPFGGTDEAQELARNLYSDNPELYFYADQYSNDNNWKAHYNTTANEIWKQTEGRITQFVTGIGTSGSITGISRKLKELNPDIRITALQPDSAMHIMEGWKHLESCKVPGIYDPFVFDQIVEVSSEESIAQLRDTARNNGLVLSPSSAANLAGANKVLNRLDRPDEEVLVTLLPDSGEKYMEVINEMI